MSWISTSTSTSQLRCKHLLGPRCLTIQQVRRDSNTDSATHLLYTCRISRLFYFWQNWPLLCHSTKKTHFCSQFNIEIHVILYIYYHNGTCPWCSLSVRFSFLLAFPVPGVLFSLVVYLCHSLCQQIGSAEDRVRIELFNYVWKENIYIHIN